MASSIELPGRHDLPAEQGKLEIILPAFPPAERKWILEMRQALDPYLLAQKPPPQTQKTLRKYYFRFRKAQQECGNGIKGLIRKIHARGNDRPKADPRSITDATDIIKAEHLTPTSSAIKAAYALHTTSCATKHISPISITWFKKLIGQIPTTVLTLERAGRGRVYSVERGTGVSYLDPDRRSLAYFSRAHIDWTEIPVELVCRYTGVNLGKAGLLAMVDSYTLDVLAWLISFFPSNRGLVLALLRMCVQLHGRLPDETVNDKGPDLTATDVQLFFSQANKVKMDRRTKKGRDGRPVEWLNNKLQRDLWVNIEGNTQNSKNPRAMTREVNPKVRAVHTIDSLHDLVHGYISRSYSNDPIGALGASPDELKQYSLIQHGNRAGTPIANNRALIIATSPTARPVYSRVDHRHGVSVAPLEYWSDEFARPGIPGIKVERKRDFLNGSRIFVRLENTWVDARSSIHPAVAQMTPRELAFLSEEYQRRHGRALSIRSESLADFGAFLSELREDESMLRELAIQRAETAHLRGVFDLDELPAVSGQAAKPQRIPAPNHLY